MKIPAVKFALILLLLPSLLSCRQPVVWHATNVAGMMPDLVFNLTGPDGESVDAKSLHGKVTLIFFGFTSCPAVCPTTLTQLSLAIKKLGPRADKVQVVLVSVDPDRDTPAVMKRYTAAFGPWLLGLTGTQKSLTKLREAYGVYAAMESSDEKGEYNVMHSAAVFAFDANGRIRLLISDVHDVNAVIEDLHNLISLSD